MFRKKGNLVGLDIGSHSVKVVQLRSRDSGAELLGLGLAPLPAQAPSDGKTTKPEAIASIVQGLVRHLGIKEKSVAAAVSGHEVISKKVEVPLMTEEELENRMQVELGHYIPYSINEVDVDYQVLDTAKDRPNYMEVLLVAAKKETVNDHVNLIKLCDLQPLVVDVDYYALSNAFEVVHGFEEKNIALVDLGASKTIMNIVCRGIPVFPRVISIGGRQITERIEDHFGVSIEEAEHAKLGESPSKLPTEELEEIFVTVVSNWVSECRKAINLFHTNFQDYRIDEIYLSGGSCRIPGLDKVFEEKLEAPVAIFNPL
ncbi:MAG TPA: type IV pilus assembly protein PilM, partial [Syntrophobacteraceae bacterium]|nr:type IV pilus assembly protein PilM [Syntrophobacteraceae bacterium]